MKPVWGLINHHDRSAFQIHLFSDSPMGPGWQGYRRHPRDRIHETATLDNDQLAELIHLSNIDILVDLNAYSSPERLALFLDRPAPVTVAWFNMYATSGLPGFDYLVADDEVVRPGEEPFFTEKVDPPAGELPDVPGGSPGAAHGPASMPGERLSDLRQPGLAVQDHPAGAGRLGEYFATGQGARLLLANRALKSVHNRSYVADQFSRRGVDTGRIMLCGPAEHLRFLQYYHRVDVALDAFPYNGGTTTMEAIWQGVPVLTFAGDRWSSRTSQSLLRRTHLEEFVAEDIEGMVESGDPSGPESGHAAAAGRAALADAGVPAGEFRLRHPGAGSSHGTILPAVVT